MSIERLSSNQPLALFQLGQFGIQQLADERRVRLAAGRLHHLPSQETFNRIGLFLARF